MQLRWCNQGSPWEPDSLSAIPLLYRWTQWSSLHSAQWWVASITLICGGGSGWRWRCLKRWHHKSGRQLSFSLNFCLCVYKKVKDHVTEGPSIKGRLFVPEQGSHRTFLMIWNQRETFPWFNNHWHLRKTCLHVIVLLCCVIYVAIFVHAHQSDQLPSQLQFYHHLLVTSGYYPHGRHTWTDRG